VRTRALSNRVRLVGNGLLGVRTCKTDDSGGIGWTGEFTSCLYISEALDLWFHIAISFRFGFAHCLVEGQCDASIGQGVLCRREA
jgi:hypothetical protein